jgi:hypothetical protein
MSITSLQGLLFTERRKIGITINNYCQSQMTVVFNHFGLGKKVGRKMMTASAVNNLVTLVGAQMLIRGH